MPIVYATLADLRAWMSLGPADPFPWGVTDADATRYLRTGSSLVTRAVEGAIYQTTADGIPLDATKATAMHDATCTQAEAWITAKIDPSLGTDQIALPVKSKSASGGGLSVTYGDADARLRLLASGVALIPQAVDYLRQAGLLVTTVVHSGGPARDTWIVGTEYRLTTGELIP